MPRSKAYQRDDVVQRAMDRFWQHGYYATSIDDLTQATGVSRYGLYAEFGDKHGMLEAAVAHYVDQVVTPAFAPVEAPGARLDAVRRYFAVQIERGARAGLPGPGCLIANLMTESGPHDALFATLVNRHLERLTTGFRHALANERAARGARSPADLTRLARFLAISAQGLWSVSRTVRSPAILRSYADDLILYLDERMST